MLGANPVKMAQVLFPEALGAVMTAFRAPLPWVMAPGGALVTIDRVALAPDQVPLTEIDSALLNRLLQEPAAKVGVEVATAAKVDEGPEMKATSPRERNPATLYI